MMKKIKMNNRQLNTGKSSEKIPRAQSAIREIERLVSQGEGIRLEFKAKANHPDKIARSLCSFANSVGGTLLLGVTDDRKISGVRYPDEDIHSILKFLRQARPHVKYRTAIIAVSDKKSVVRFDIIESKRKPVILRMDKGLAFIRIGDESLQAGPVMKGVLEQKSSVQGSVISFGDAERNILRLFQTGQVLTFRQIAVSTGLPAKVLLPKLVSLVSSGILQSVPGMQEENFKMNLFS